MTKDVDAGTKVNLRGEVLCEASFVYFHSVNGEGKLHTMLAAGMHTRHSGHIGQDGWICRQAAALMKTGRQGVGPAYGSGCAASACASRDWSVLFAPPAASP